MITPVQEAQDHQDERLAKVAYSGYCGSTGGRSVIYGDVLPDWEHLAEPVQKAWRAAAEAVVTALSADRDPFGEEEVEKE
jgi:hypothetical protein